jgi:iron(III) transport system substrate-binding protein
MKKISRRFFMAGGTAALAIACSQQPQKQETSSQTTPQTNKRQEVNIYSSRHYNTDDQLYDGFTAKTGIKVNLIEGKDDELIERIKSEGANSPSDILITVDAGRLWRAEEAGIFAPVESQVLNDKIPANLRSPKNLWFGFSKRARVIMYNKNRIKPSDLSTYEALAEPQWKGKIIMRSSSNIYNQSLVAAMLEVNGEQKTEAWCKGLIANLVSPPEGTDTSSIEAVAGGIADLTLANTYYLPRFKEDKDPAKQAIFDQIGVFFPNQNDRGTHINISGAGMTTTAPNKENAIAFLEYLASPEAQKFFAQGNNEYPAVAGTPLNDIVAGFGKFKEDTVNVAAYGANNAEAVKIMDRSGWT